MELTQISQSHLAVMLRPNLELRQWPITALERTRHSVGVYFPLVQAMALCVDRKGGYRDSTELNQCRRLSGRMPSGAHMTAGGVAGPW